MHSWKALRINSHYYCVHWGIRAIPTKGVSTILLNPPWSHFCWTKSRMTSLVRSNISQRHMFICQAISPSLQTLEKWLLQYHLQLFVRGRHLGSLSSFYDISKRVYSQTWDFLGTKVTQLVETQDRIDRILPFSSFHCEDPSALRTMSPWDSFKGPASGAVTQWHSPEIEMKDWAWGTLSSFWKRDFNVAIGEFSCAGEWNFLKFLKHSFGRFPFSEVHCHFMFASDCFFEKSLVRDLWLGCMRRRSSLRISNKNEQS